MLSATEQDRRTFNYDRYLRNLARPKVTLGQFDAAKADLDEAEAFQTTVYGADSHFHGEYVTSLCHQLYTDVTLERRTFVLR